MNVSECIDYYKQRTRSRVNKVWLCPQIVNNPKVGKEYTYEVAISSALPDKLLNSEVTKHWLEPGECICMAIKCDSGDISDLLNKGSANTLYNS